MNKKIIMLIIGIILLILGFLGAYIINSENNLDNKELEDIKAVQEETLKDEAVSTEELKAKEEKPVAGKKLSKPVTKPADTKVPHKNITQNPIPQTEETPLFSETVVQSKEFEDPYVDADGTIVVKNEFKPQLKDKVYFRGVLYNIKTKLAEKVEN